MRNRNVVIVSPHFPPSGLPPAHRTRQFARYLPDFGWTPIVLTVQSQFYQEPLDPELMQLVSPDLEVIRTTAIRPKRPGGFGIGDLGLRSFFPIYRALRRLCQQRRARVIYMPCPPNYPLVLGRRIWEEFAVPYVFDYIDPWICDWLRKTAKPFTKPWMGHLLSVLLEPYAIRRVSHVTAVSKGTNDSVRTNHPWLKESQFSALPYGGEPELFEDLRRHPQPSLHLERRHGQFQLVYLGAMWEAAYGTLDTFLDAVRRVKEQQPEIFARLRIHFLGTTYRPDAKGHYQILPRAREKGVAEVIHEQPERLPFLEALRTLSQADGLLMLGSCEPHYTASRLLPYLHAQRPLFAVFHEESDATRLIRSCRPATLITYGSTRPVATCTEEIASRLVDFIRQTRYDPAAVDWSHIAKFSARAMTAKLAEAFDHIVDAETDAHRRKVARPMQPTLV